MIIIEDSRPNRNSKDILQLFAYACFFYEYQSLRKEKKFDAMLYIFQLLKCTYSKQNIDRCDTLEFKESTKIYLL